MKIELLPLSKIKENEANPRRITKDKFARLVDSLISFPAMLSIRPIVVDDSLTVLGGNMRYRALLHISQMPFDEIKKHTKGNKFNESQWHKFLDKPTCPVIKASDLTDEEKQRFIIEDNIPFGEWDWDKLANEWEETDLEAWGLDVWKPEGEKGKDENEQEKGNIYTSKVESPQYEPRGEKPPLSSVFDRQKYDQLIERIDKSGVPEDEKVFLRLAAARHIVFNYEKIADYYAHADKETQVLFEDSALVIIDFDSAIEKGYVVLLDKMNEQCKEDSTDDEE